MEQKKSLAGRSGSKFFDRPVHERLHSAAIAKQQISRTKNRSHSHRGPSPNTSFEQERLEKIDLSSRVLKKGFKSASRKPPVPMMIGSAKSQNSHSGSSPQAPGTNFGERLYRRGLKKREELEHRLRNARSE